MFEKANAGGNGIGGFYSPMFGEELTSGYTRAGNTGWSVFVSQPINELESKIEDITYSSLSAMAIGLFVAILLALIATKLLTFPIIQMVQAMERIGNGQLRAYENIQEGRFQPLEFSFRVDERRGQVEPVIRPGGQFALQGNRVRRDVQRALSPVQGVAIGEIAAKLAAP